MGQTELVFTLLVPVMLFIMMMGMGLSLTVADFKRIFLYPRAAIIGLSGQLLFLPLLAFALAQLIGAPAAVAAGGMLLAACPGGVTSNGYVFVSRGDVGLSITLTAITSVVTVLTIPAITWFTMNYYYGAGQFPELPVFDIVRRLLLITALPIVLGMLLRAYKTDIALRMVEGVRKVSLVLLLAIIVGVTISTWGSVQKNFLSAGALAISLNVISMGAGWGAARAFGLPPRQVITITYEIGVQNLSLAILVAITILKMPELSILAVVYALVMKVTALSFLWYVRRTGYGSDATQEARAG